VSRVIPDVARGHSDRCRTHFRNFDSPLSAVIDFPEDSGFRIEGLPRCVIFFP